MAIFITINGPLGVGKTWTVNQLKAYFGIQGVQFIDVNFQEPIRKLAYELLELASGYPYDKMKAELFWGVLGRDWIIQISEGMKQKYPEIWVRKALNRIHAGRITKEEFLGQAGEVKHRVFIADSQGFEVELMPIQEWSQLEGNTWIPIGIEPPEKRHLRGKKWQENDSRFNLCHMLPPANVVPDSNEAYWLLKNKLQELGM